MSIPTLTIRVPSSAQHLSDSSPYQGGDTEESPYYTFAVIREDARGSPTWHRSSNRSCRARIDSPWHLPLWLLFFGGTVSILTLLFLLTGTVYPAPTWWTRYGTHSLGVLKIAGDVYRSGHLLSGTNHSTLHPLASVSYVEPTHVFARLTSTGDITISSTIMRRPSTSGPASLVDNTLSLLVQVRIPDTPRDARCMIASGITLTKHLETAGKATQVHLWSLTGTTSDVNALGEKYWTRREAHVSTFDVRPGEVPVQRSGAFACPPSRSLQTFEVSCADGDDACSVEPGLGSTDVYGRGSMGWTVASEVTLLMN
ncbi:hypothetical protein BJV74DRAFT_883753 [Russula compacta]|nr:hypothetical protein BJV74DRAFT_883753 [Russula compacta]